MAAQGERSGDLAPFDRRFFDSPLAFTRIGGGGLGGKAAGLIAIRDRLLPRLSPQRAPGVVVDVPVMAVVATDHFDEFLQRNAGLRELALSDAADDRIAHAFQRAELPAELVGDLRALIAQVHTPLAVRSSSLLEDALEHPFAGVYDTKMIPNNQPGVDARFSKLVEAIKFVWASTFTRAAKAYVTASKRDIADEKMAVVIQELVGQRHEDRFYPTLSGVGRSWNFYPMPPARPDQGVVSLALGLGKSIVDGGRVWTYSPGHPHAGPPAASARELLAQTQSGFWAVNMGKPPAFDPIRETEYLLQCELRAAEQDGQLDWLASTYDAQSDRLSHGVMSEGARALTFAPLLVSEVLPLNERVRELLEVAADEFGRAVEIEFAMNLAPTADGPHRLGFLQVRPLMVSDEVVDLAAEQLAGPSVLVGTEMALGNGRSPAFHDIVYVKPGAFEAAQTRQIAQQIDALNASLVAQRLPYLLIGFGRWGSSDPWLGIPVMWSQIAGALAVVEATLPDMDVEASQGSHFFHNLASFQVSYLMVRHGRTLGIDWTLLDAQPAVAETEFVRHVRMPRPLRVEVDGRSGRGRVRMGEAAEGTR